jgi:hypothetical protein
MYHLQRFQSSPNSAINPVNLKKVVEEMSNETHLNLKEKVDAIRVCDNFF